MTHDQSKFYSTSKDIIDLYTKIPDYAQVKHLGNSEFINTLERLKDEFRQIRASLYEDSTNSDYETDLRSTNIRRGEKSREKILNVKNDYEELKTSGRLINHVPVHQKLKFLENKSAPLPTIGSNNQHQYLSIRSCELHQAPAHYNYQPQHTYFNNETRKSNLCNLGTSCASLDLNKPSNKYLYDSKTDSAFQDDDEIETHNTSNEKRVGFGTDRRIPSANSVSSQSSKSTTGSTTISIWSSNPEIYQKPYKEFVPPTNIEKRIQWRNSKNYSTSEPQLYNKSKETNREALNSQFVHFKAHPVPDHVHQPLFDKIMLRNKLRSDQVREQSKQKLLAQVKPFSFTTTPTPSTNKFYASPINDRKSFDHGVSSGRKDFFSSNKNHEIFLLNKNGNKDPNKSKSRGRELLANMQGLNNTRHARHHRKQNLHPCFRHANNKHLFESTGFKANPAPPRTRALMAAVRLREQQEYRELKKRLRAEALMKTSSLPPSMAARDRQEKASEAKINAILNQLNSTNIKRHQQNILKTRNKFSATRNRRLSSSSTEDFAGTTLNSDDDDVGGNKYSDEEHGLTSSLSSKPEINNKVCPKTMTKKCKNFTPFGPSKFSPKQDGIFEATSNDNHASRLRAQTAKKREQERIKREEEEQIRLQRMENRRQRLRIWHLPAWKHASSYSSTQDISMRCELRQVASILEKESFRRDMNNMLSRVQSAPLLLEGLRERKYELCKKHKQELAKVETQSPRNKFYSPRTTEVGKSNWTTTSHIGFLDDHGGYEKSETAAIAEGGSRCSNATNSDNESVIKNIELDSIAHEDQDYDNDGANYEEEEQALQGSIVEDKEWNNNTVNHNNVEESKANNSENNVHKLDSEKFNSHEEQTKLIQENINSETKFSNEGSFGEFCEAENENFDVVDQYGTSTMEPEEKGKSRNVQNPGNGSDETMRPEEAEKSQNVESHHNASISPEGNEKSINYEGFDFSDDETLLETHAKSQNVESRNNYASISPERSEKSINYEGFDNYSKGTILLENNSTNNTALPEGNDKSRIEESLGDVSNGGEDNSSQQLSLASTSNNKISSSNGNIDQTLPFDKNIDEQEPISPEQEQAKIEEEIDDDEFFN